MPFIKGQSGNPGGRTKASFSISTACQKHGEEVVNFMLAVSRGEAVARRTRQVGSRGKKVITLDTPTFQDRLRAAEWLADRGWGKAPTVVAGPGGVGPAELVIHWGEPPPTG